MLKIHRKVQWDLADTDVKPIICINWGKGGSSYRLFCLWRWGIWVGWPDLG